MMAKGKPTQSIFLGLLALSSMWFGHQLEAKDQKPNLIHIMADDLRKSGGIES